NGNVARLQQQLAARGFSTGVAGDNNSCDLAGTSNLGGRATNGSPNPVTTPGAPPTVERFIHIEQHKAGVRDTTSNRARVLDAIANTVFIDSGPVTLSTKVTGYGRPDNSPPGTAIAYPQI